MNPTRRTALIVLIATLAGSTTVIGPASAAAWPASVAGTWVVDGNGFHPHTLKLIQKDDKAKCKQVTGTLDFSGQPQQKMYGFYCPQSGRIVLTRVYEGQTIQIWHGQISQPSAGTPPIIAGGIAAVTALGGVAGETAFRGSHVDRDD